MNGNSQMTRQQYRRLQMIRHWRKGLGQSGLKRYGRYDTGWFNESGSRHLAHHLNVIIAVLLFLILVVYLILVFVNF